MKQIVFPIAKLLIICVTLASLISCEPDTREYNYGLEPVHTQKEFLRILKKDSAQQLVNLRRTIPKARFDIRYATSENFVGTPMYDTPGAYARKEVAEALAKIQTELMKEGLSLVIFDAYRPYSVTVKFYESYKDTTYVASPYTGSRHNRGAAIDLSLMDIKTGKYLNMGTPYDDFTEAAHPYFPGHGKEVIKNRSLLFGIMKKNGFEVYHSEWWHFDYKGWEKYDLLDLSFDQLEQIEPLTY